jgi:hypothetical protein
MFSKVAARLLEGLAIDVPAKVVSCMAGPIRRQKRYLKARIV